MLSEILKRRLIPFLIILTTIVAIIAGVDAFVLEKGEGKTNMISDAVGIVVAPVQGAVTWVFDNMAAVGNYFGDIARLKAENRELKKTVLTLERENLQMETYKQENDRLRGLLDLKAWNRDYETVGAEIIARDSTVWFKIDKGSMHGISKNDVVMENSGLVGYVSEVGTTWAIVTTILSPGADVSCILPRTGEIVMIEGGTANAMKELCKMTYISSDSTIVVGEAVETSGEGGIYPKGIFVGRIESVSEEQNGLSKEAYIRPMADFGSLREVLVIKLDKSEG